MVDCTILLQLSRSSSSSSIAYIPPPPLVVKVETGFKPVKSSSMLTVSVKNYDGTETRQTISEGPSGKTTSELILDTEGKVIKKAQSGLHSFNYISSLDVSYWLHYEISNLLGIF